MLKATLNLYTNNVGFADTKTKEQLTNTVMCSPLKLMFNCTLQHCSH